MFIHLFIFLDENRQKHDFNQTMTISATSFGFARVHKLHQIVRYFGSSKAGVLNFMIHHI